MTERAYSVDDIDRMRQAIRHSYGTGNYRQSERDANIEDRLRTYMTAGIGPDELEARFGRWHSLHAIVTHAD